MFSFYKSTEVFEMVTLLLIKAREKNLKVALLFKNDDEAAAFSQKLWNLYNPIAHGLAKDGFAQKQPVILGSNLIQKDVAIILCPVAFENFQETFAKFQKVFFIGEHNQKLATENSKYWEYKTQKWIQLQQDQFWANA